MSELAAKYDCGTFAAGQVWRDIDGNLYTIGSTENYYSLTVTDTWGRVRQFRRSHALQNWKQIKLARKPRKQKPPRYDDIYFDGITWLNGL